MTKTKEDDIIIIEREKKNKRKEERTMKKNYEEMIDNVIRKWGFEHPITIEFCRLCEKAMKNESLNALTEGFYNGAMR